MKKINLAFTSLILSSLLMANNGQTTDFIKLSDEDFNESTKIEKSKNEKSLKEIKEDISLEEKISISLKKLIEKTSGKSNNFIVEKVIKVNNFEGLYLSVVKDISNDTKVPLYTNNEGTIAMAFNENIIVEDFDSMGIKDTLIELNEYNKVIPFNKLLKEIKEENILKLYNDKDSTLVIFTDPECPFCRQELENLEDRLKTHNIDLIFTPVHGKTSYQKSDLIYQIASKLETNEEKIKIIRKYYDDNYKLTEEEKKTDTNRISELVKQVFKTGLVKGVPFIFEKKN